MIKIRKTAAVVLALLMIISVCACGAAPAEGAKPAPAAESQSAAAPEASGKNVVEVSDVDALLEAIAPDTEIVLAPGRYNLTRASLYGKEGDNRCITWETYGFEREFELHILDADNLTIRGESAEIVTEPRSADVMYFEFCRNLVLDGIRIGHTEATEACQGGVVYLSNCKNALIKGCSLYGCGTVGVFTERSDDMTVENCDIYHCSSSAAWCSNSLNLTFSGCRIYDCGKFNGYISRSPLFGFSGVKGAKLSGCDIYDNFGSSLVYQSSTAGVEMENISFQGNRIDVPFASQSIACTNLTMKDNVFGRWFDGENTGKLTVDGKKVSADDLDRLYPGQMSYNGGELVDIGPVNISTEGTKEIHVKTADEFLKAIGPDTLIIIDADKIDLTTASDYVAEPDEEYYGDPVFSGVNYVWHPVYDGSELAIGNVYNLHIRGGEIVTRPGYANVLSFWDSKNISLEGVTLGHDREPGSCCGGVVYIKNCGLVVLEDCDLYGCGVTGVTGLNSTDIFVQKSKIHDCSYSASEFTDCTTVTFIDAVIENCPDPNFILYNCNAFTWNRRLIDSYASFSPKEKDPAAG